MRFLDSAKMAADTSCEEQPDLGMTAKRSEPLHFCDICQVACSTVLHLSDHIGGSKHRNAVGGKPPEVLAKLHRLQYFIDTYMKEEPMIGLEYVIERYNPKAKYEYMYKCLLCKIHCPRGLTLLHLCGGKHRSAYLEKHHPDLVVEQLNFTRKSQYSKELKAAALQVELIHGRKRIHEVADEQIVKNSGPVSAKVPKMPSTNVNRLEDIKTNEEFLDYLRNFEVKNDSDASFIQSITKNCINALMRFREEETKIQVSSTKACNGDQTNNTNPTDKTNFSSVNSPKECSPSAQIPSIFQNPSEATEAFFKSIKNMSVSEVVVILRKIASTNPAYQEINIPSLIKYLQDTGRLKNS